jgi:hypothetical protein
MKLPVRAKVFILVIVVLCFASLGYAAVSAVSPTVSQLALFGFFVTVAVLADIYATRIPAYRWEISSCIAIKLASLFILGLPLSIFLTFTSTLLSEVLLRWKRAKEGWSSFVLPVSFNTGQLVVTMVGAGLVLQFSGHHILPLRGSSQFFLASLVCLVYLLLNLSLVTGIVSLTTGKRFFSSLLKSLQAVAVQCFVLCVLALLITVLYSFSIGYILLALVPLVLVHASFRSYLKLRTEARKTFESIARILDERDHYTAVHSNDVAKLAVAIAREMKLSEEAIEKIDVAARVHDIGKVAVPDSILLKPGGLTDEEWTMMKRHSVVSAELIGGLEIYAPVADSVRHEHERWDGSGYPDGLEGKKIPLLARIIAAADVYSALITDRPYRKAFSREAAIKMIREMRGKDLDPVVTDALLRVLSAQEA